MADRSYWVETDKRIAEASQVLGTLQHKVLSMNEALENRWATETFKAKVTAELPEVEAKLETARQAYCVEAIKYDGWNRYWLVANPGGHIHSSTGCSTCFPTTEFMWLTEYSGMEVDELVGLAGERACTVCFSEAPVADRPSMLSYDVEQRAAAEARRTERSTKAAEKLAKAILPDGSKLRLSASYGQGGTVSDDASTIVSAKIAAVRNMAYGLEDFPGVDAEHTEHLKSLRMAYMSLGHQFTKAVAERTGQDFDTLLAELAKKAEKKARA